MEGLTILKRCTVNVIWDAEAEVWYTQSDDIPGLVLESHYFELLLSDYKSEAAYMLEANCNYKGPFELSFETKRIEYVEDAS